MKMTTTLLLLLISQYSFAKSYCFQVTSLAQESFEEDHIVCKVQAANSLVTEKIETHKAMSKEEIIKDWKTVIKIKEDQLLEKKALKHRTKREKFQETIDQYKEDASIFMKHLESLSANEILVLEADISGELSQFNYKSYDGFISQVHGEGAIVGLFFGSIFDLASSPFRLIKNSINESQTEWARSTVAFLVKY